MNNVFVSGLVNIETTVKVRDFPIEYYPVDYPFFGVNSAVSGVGYNIAKALTTLGDKVSLAAMIGKDFEGEKILTELSKAGVNTKAVSKKLKATPASVVLYDNSGKRQIYCDLKDIQDACYSFTQEFMDSDIVVACNINFNRDLLKKAKEQGKIIATDVHILSDINDEYNRDFLEKADIVFLSDEGINSDYKNFLKSIYNTYHNKIIVLGMGCKGAMMLIENTVYELSAVKIENVVNTIGAGDSLFSGFIHYYAKGCEPLESLRKAEIFASEKIKANGGARGFVSESVVDKLAESTVIDINKYKQIF